MTKKEMFNNIKKELQALKDYDIDPELVLEKVEDQVNQFLQELGQELASVLNDYKDELV